MTDFTKRLTCRDGNGHIKLMPDANLMEAIEKLGIIEERGAGVLVIENGAQCLGSGWHCRDCRHYDGPPHSHGNCLVHPDRDKQGNVRGPHRIVQGSRRGCADKFEAKEAGE